MLNSIFILVKSRASVVRRINIDTFNFATKFLLQGLKRQQIVAKDQSVVEDIMIGNSLRGMIRLRWIFKKNPRLQAWPCFLPDPIEFKSMLYFRHCFRLVA